MRSVLAAFLLVVAMPASGAIYRPTSVEDLARDSDAVVRGRVERQRSYWSADGRLVLTEVTIAVSDAWKGAPGGRVKVVVRGGRIGDFAQIVGGMHAFEDGEDVVVFVARRRGGDTWALAGFSLGKYRVVGDEARPDMDAIAFAPGSVRAGERLVSPMTVSELKGRVRSAR